MTHTWDLFLYYHACPACGFIVESREDFKNIMGKNIKNVTCPRCHHHFSLEKQSDTRSISPLFGKQPKPEFDWS